MSVLDLVQRIVTTDWAVADQAAVTAALTHVRQVRGWLDSVEINAASRLAELTVATPSIFPEQIVAEAGRVSLPEASRGFDRAITTAAIPEMGTALSDGHTSGRHVDVVTSALRQLSEEQGRQFAQRGDVIALAATTQPRDEFARTIRAEVRRVRTDDGIDLLQQQRRNASLRTWTDKDTGMWCLRGEFDPETGALLAGRLRSTIETLFHDQQPDTCPADPLLKQHHLRALALDALTKRGGSVSSDRIDMSVLVDAETLMKGEHADSIIDFGLEIDLPIETLRRWACVADITPIIVGADGVSLYVGRTRRTANRTQRRALRAMYRGCAIHGCGGAFDNCEIHHITWFRNGGGSDIDNFVPLCHRHHHLAHEGGWKVALDGRRNLTIVFPDGSIMTTGPPSAWAR